MTIREELLILQELAHYAREMEYVGRTEKKFQSYNITVRILETLAEIENLSISDIIKCYVQEAKEVAKYQDSAECQEKI